MGATCAERQSISPVSRLPWTPLDRTSTSRFLDMINRLALECVPRICIKLFEIGAWPIPTHRLALFPLSTSFAVRTSKQNPSRLWSNKIALAVLPILLVVGEGAITGGPAVLLVPSFCSVLPVTLPRSFREAAPRGCGRWATSRSVSSGIIIMTDTSWNVA